MKVLPTVSTLSKPTAILKKAILPASALGVLAGSSMGPQIPRRDVVHVPGSSVEDPFIDQVGYFADKLVDMGKEAGNAILDGAEQLIDKLGNIGSGAASMSGLAANNPVDTTDLVDMGDTAADALETLLDVNAPVIDATGDIISEVLESAADILF
jgi:hypothetical protein